jgi:hypothetical protein
MKIRQSLYVVAAALTLGVTFLAQPARAGTKCTMTYRLDGWSIFYRTASGSGTITCDNGQSARVSIHAKGGGVTFGRIQIDHGKGTFSEVSNISELFGSYAAAEAHAGGSESTDVQALTKGTVSLALKGKGTGPNVGVSFGKVTIERE